MAYWGMALVLGPNINLEMSPDNERPAYETIKRAASLKENASERERAYIDALATRYSGAENPPAGSGSSLYRSDARAQRPLPG